MHEKVYMAADTAVTSQKQKMTMQRIIAVSVNVREFPPTIISLVL